MRKEKLIFKKLLLLILNLSIFFLVFINTKATLSPTRNAQALSFPENSLIFDFRLESLKINRIVPDVSLVAPVSDLRSVISDSKERFLIDFTGSGKASFYLTKSEDEVLAGANIDVDSAFLNIHQTLGQDSPGEYSCDFRQSYQLTSNLAVSQIDKDIGNWQFIPLGVRVNSRLQEVFSYTDCLSNLNYQDNSPPVEYEIPLEIDINFQLLDEKSIPLANKSITLDLSYPAQDSSRDITLVSDSQGIINYTFSEKLKVNLSGGRLVELGNPLFIPDALYQTKLIDQNNRTHQVWAPIKGMPDSPPIIMFWGEGGGRRRPAPIRGGEDTQQGKDIQQNLGPSKYNPDAGVDPINLTMGNVYTQAVDIFIPSKGLPIKFERTYNSLDGYNGVLGFGWTHSYNINIALRDSENLAVLMLGDGRRIYFTRDATGKYNPPKGEYSKLVKNTNGTFTWTSKYGEIYNFNNAGKLAEIKDRNNNQIALTYDSNNNLIRVTASGGRKIDLSYDSKNRITSISLPNGSAIRYTYDSEGNLISVTDAQGGITKYKYAPYNLLEVITDPNGHNRYFAYDWYSRGISFSYDYNNHKISITYDEANNKTIVTDSKGNKTEYYYQLIDGVKLINKIIDANQKTEEFTWDANLNRTQAKDKNGNISRMAYDTQGNILTITDPQGNVTIFTYESKYNLVTSVKDALNSLTTFVYDTNGNLKTITDPLGKKTEFTYDSQGQLIKLTNARGYNTQFSYNPFGDLASTTDALGNTTSFEYDLVGNCVKITDAKGNITTFKYNTNNQLTKITYPDATYTTFTYDATGNRQSVRDYLGNVTQYEYDAVDRLAKVIDALSNETIYNYDSEGNLICVTDTQSNQTCYEYDILNRLIKTINAAGIATEYSYDNLGNRTRVKDAKANLIGYTYDSLNRLTKITYPDTSVVEFTYDKLSRRKTMKDKLGITTYDYDALSRLLSVDGPGTKDTIRYEYDEVGNRKKMVDQDGGITTYTYDELNRLKTLTDPQAKVTTYNYDKLSNLSSVSYPNSTLATSTFDNLSRLLSLTNKKTTGEALSNYQYQYDSIGRRTKMAMPDATVDFTYDKLSQLASEKRIGANPYAISYAYDKVGNRLSRTPGANSVFYTCNTLNQLTEERIKSSQDSAAITVVGTVDDNTAKVLVQNKPATVGSGQFSASNITVNRGLNLITAMAEDLAGNQSYHQIQLNVVDPLQASYTYDNNGNLIKKQEGTNAFTYTYDYENRLISVAKNGSNLATYTYDGEGKRIRATESGVTTDFLYDGLNVIIERNTSGTTTAFYIRGLSYGGGIGGIISRKDSSGTCYYHYDGLGNVMQLTNASATVVKTYTYEAFGSLVAQTGTITNPYQFQTKYTSPATGLVHFGFRSYNPTVGRFITPDPLGFVNGPNVYAYVGNNPLNWIDPWGLCGEKPWWEKALDWWLLESALPGWYYGQPVSEWGPYGPTGGYTPMVYTEAAGGGWMWTERVAFGISAGAAITAGGLIIGPKIVGPIKRNVAVEGPSPSGRIVQIRIRNNMLILRLDYHPLTPTGKPTLHINIEVAGQNIHIPLE